MYDPRVIEEFARRLLRKAKAVVFVCILSGATIGALWAYPTSNGNGIVTVLVALISAGVGYAIGAELAFRYRLTAQTALCQVMIERNTRAAAYALAPPAPEEVAA